MKPSYKILLFTLTAIQLNLSGFSQAAKKIPLRVAVAGISHGHSSWLYGSKKTNDIEVVGIFEKDTALIEVYRKRFGIDKSMFYDNLDAMLDKLRPDAVVAFNPTNEHLSVVEACAPKGIHVMVEKPLATNYSAAKRMADLAAIYRIHLLTNYETSWYPSTEKTFQLVNDSNYVGTLRKVIVRDGHEGARNTEANKFFFRWLTDPVKNGGGALTDFGCYGANLMTYLMKNEKPISVVAITRQFKPDIYPLVDDEATVIVNYKNAQCIIEASWNWPYNRKDMEVYGDKGYLIAKNDSIMDLRNRSGRKEETKKYTNKDIMVYDNPFEYFNAVVRGKIQPLAYNPYSLENNKIVVEIIDAARKSAKSGKVIYLK